MRSSCSTTAVASPRRSACSLTQSWRSRDIRLLQGAVEGVADVVQLLRDLRHVGDEGAVAVCDVARQFLAHFPVTAHEVRAHGLVVLEGHEPIGALALLRGEPGKLLVPYGIRDPHRELMGDLSLAVLGETRTCCFPGRIALLAADNADADARIQPAVSLPGVILHRL